jgi:hypothetical protein
MTRRAPGRVAPWLALVIALAASGAPAQEAPTPDVPGGSGHVEGRIEPADDPAAVAEAEVILYSLSESGEPGLRRGRADAEGRFRFENLDPSPSVVYLVGTRVAGVPFGARFSFDPGETRASVRIAVSAPTSDATELAAGEAHVMLAQGCRDLRVQQVYEVRNPTGRVVFVPPDARADAVPPLEFELPEAASAIETPLGNTEGFERDGRRLRFWGPIYAGGQRVEIGYGLTVQGDTLELGFAAGTESVRVFTPKTGLHATGAGLRALGEQRLPSGPHRAQQMDALPPSRKLVLQIEGATPAAQADVQLTDARLWIELDDVRAQVNEVHRIETPGPGPLESATGGPLVCIGLPEGASNLRFSNEALELGLSRDPSGALALHGPLPAGTAPLALRYDLPVTGGRAVLDRTFESDLPLLSVLVADTGLIPVTDRLHRKRAVRTQDRSYLHLEGFAVAADERVALTLEPIETRARWPALASSGLLFALALASLAFLSAPLRAGTPEALSSGEEISTERAAIYAAIDALDEDFETDKLSEEDHARMRAELRARAVQLLETERTPPEATPAAPTCPACKAEVGRDARFCAQCGHALASQESAGS